MKLPGIGNNCCGASCSDTSHNKSDAFGKCLSLNFDIKLSATPSADNPSV